MAGPAESAGFLREAVIYLAATVVLVPLFTRAGLGGTLGYLAAGVVIGPHALGFVRSPDAVRSFSELGIVLLLFVIGLELRPARLWQLRRDIFGLGAAQVVLTGLALTVAVHLLTALSWPASLVVGLPLALSSTALVIGLLEEKDALNTPKGQRAFAILLFQDLAIVPLLAVVAALSRVPDPAAPPAGQQVVYTLLAIGGLALAGRFVMTPLFRALATLGAREAFVAAALLTVSGAAWAMSALHLSMALGAFVAGVMLADSPYRHELEADIEPFRGMLLGLFFIAIGMSLDLGVVRANFGMIVTLVTVLMLVKTAMVAALARAFGSPWPSARGLGIILSQGGEFGFVIFGAAAAGLLITRGAADLFSAVVVLSMALTPLAVKLLPKPKTADEDDAAGLAGPEEAGGGKAIIVGYGRFGQAIGQMLMARGIEVVLIDTKPSQIKVSIAFGIQIYYGDGRRVDVLRAAGAANADLIVFSADGVWLDKDVLDPIKRAFPRAKILARAYDRRHYIKLVTETDGVVRELFESAVKMGRMALEALDVPPETVDAIEAEYRRRDAERLEMQTITGKIETAKELLFLPERPMDVSAMGEIPFAEPAPAPLREAAE